MGDFQSWLKEQREIDSNYAEANINDHSYDAHHDAFLETAACNYRKMLDALEIAMNGLEHFCDCVSPYAGACGNCTATIKIKQKLGVTE